MTRDFLKPQKTTGLDTNAPIAKQSPFASRPFARIPRPEMSPQDIQTMRERAARIEQLGNPMIKAWANTQPTVQQQAMPEEEKEENLQTKQESTVQRQESEEEETLQTKSEPSLQREELPEEEDETLQMQSEPDVQLKCQDCEQEQAEVQTKLTIGQPGDKYEQEADNMAAQVMSMPDPTAENLQRQETEEETLQQKPLTDSITPVVQRQTSETPQQDSTSQSLESQLAAEKGSGSLLSDEVRGFMEPRFGADFSEVRVHTGTAAVQMNKELGAQAFTHGNDIYYGKGKAPGNDALTAHELTHTIQQNGTLASSSLQRQHSSSKNDDGNELRQLPQVEDVFDLYMKDNSKDVRVEIWRRLEIKRQRGEENHLEYFLKYVDGLSGDENRKDYMRRAINYKLKRIEVSESDTSTIQDPQKLINEHTTYGNLLEDKLGLTLLGYAQRGDYKFVQTVIDKLAWKDRDDVALEMMEAAGKSSLDQFAQSDTGQKMLNHLYDELTSGALGNQEKSQANRILEAQQRTLIEAEDFVEAVSSSTTKIFPYRPGGMTVLDHTPIHAERRSKGKIWVEMPVAVLGTKMFQNETRTLPTEVFGTGIELPKDEIIGVKRYDEGGKVEYKPALYLIQLSNELDTNNLVNISTAATAGFSLGLGGAAAGAAGTMSKVVRAVNTAVDVLGTVTLIIKEHQGWFISRFGWRGKVFIDHVKLVDAVIGIYGGFQALGKAGKLVNNLRKSYQDWRSVVKMLSGDLDTDEYRIVNQISEKAREFLELSNQFVSTAGATAGNIQELEKMENFVSE